MPDFFDDVAIAAYLYAGNKNHELPKPPSEHYPGQALLQW
jgi:hypothetical protein